MSEHLHIQIYSCEAEARGIAAKAAIVPNDSIGVSDALEYARQWGVHPDVIECVVVTWNDDDPDDEMREPQGNLSEYAEAFDYPKAMFKNWRGSNDGRGKVAHSERA